MTIDIIQEANERSHIICSVEALKGEFSFIFIALYILFKIITFFLVSKSLLNILLILFPQQNYTQIFLLVMNIISIL